jgi:signal transduction histidine kinase
MDGTTLENPAAQPAADAAAAARIERAARRAIAPGHDRERLAREVHDAVSQTLFAAGLVAGAMARDPRLDPAARAQAETVARLNHGALAELRLLRLELEPDALARAPLAELLGHACAVLAARGELRVAGRIDAIEPPAPRQVLVYRVVQEALLGAAGHVGMTRITLDWTRLGAQRARLAVGHDGAADDSPDSASARTMRGYAAALGARLALQSDGAGRRIEMAVGW